MINYLLDIYNQILGSNLLEPTMMVWISFIMFFIVIPIVALYLGIKIAIWLVTLIRDWWHDGRK